MSWSSFNKTAQWKEEIGLLNELSDLISSPDSVIAGGMPRDITFNKGWQTDLDMFVYYTGQTFMIEPILEIWAKSKEEPPYPGDYEPYENFILLDGTVKNLAQEGVNYSSYAGNEHIIAVYELNMLYCHYRGQPGHPDNLNKDFSAPLQIILVNKPTKEVIDNFPISISQCALNKQGELYLSDKFEWSKNNHAVIYDRNVKTKYFSKLFERYRDFAWLPDNIFTDELKILIEDANFQVMKKDYIQVNANF